MFHVCVQKFDVAGIVEIFLRTKHGRNLLRSTTTFDYPFSQFADFYQLVRQPAGSLHKFLFYIIKKMLSNLIRMN